MIKRISRRDFIKYLAAAGTAGAGIAIVSRADFDRVAAQAGGPRSHGMTHTASTAPAAAKRISTSHKKHGRTLAAGQAVPGGTLNPLDIPKYVTPLLIPPVMPRNTRVKQRGGQNVDYYEISVEQFQQQILPPADINNNPIPPTTVWGYGSYGTPGTHNAPSFTIEAKWNRPVRIKWINNLIEEKTVDGVPVKGFRPHILPVDQTLHWANPPGPRDMHGHTAEPYTGPVPFVTHVHGAHTTEESDGYAEAWYLPPAGDIPSGYFTTGTWYDTFKSKFAAKYGVNWDPGSATFQYPNDQDASTLWYHDHTLGMTRLNVYAGPAGFYIIRGGPGDAVTGALPGPAPKPNDPPGKKYYEIPIAIQDRSFNADGSLFFPDNRAFFEGLTPKQLQIPFIPEAACDGQPSDISPIWNPEFFGNTMMVNGKTWPNLDVEPRRYRFRLLNGCNSRFVILKVASSATGAQGQPGALPIWQIGAEGGFLPNQAVMHDSLLIAPAERADVIVDFTGLTPGTVLYLINEGPDEPFGGGAPGTDFNYADPDTTGQVMKFTVVPLASVDNSTPPAQLVLPARAPLPPASNTRQVSLLEEESGTVLVVTDEDGNILLACDNEAAAPFGPKAALCGTVDLSGAAPAGIAQTWMSDITENPATGATEVWEIYNFTVDAHPIHIHQVMFEVLEREVFDSSAGQVGTITQAHPNERGMKDTVIVYPGELARVKATFNLPGLYVWHCHIVDHEDNEMMRPFAVGPVPAPLQAAPGSQATS